MCRADFTLEQIIIIHQTAVCPVEDFYRREHGLRLLEELSAPVLNTTQTYCPSAAVSQCTTIKSLATDRNNTSRQTVYEGKRHRLHGPKCTAALTARTAHLQQEALLCHQRAREQRAHSTYASSAERLRRRERASPKYPDFVPPF